VKGKWSVVFVCQPGDIAIQAALLAASLRRYLGSGADLLAGVPLQRAEWDSLGTPVLKMLDTLKVQLLSITNPIGAEYPIANKIACLGVATGADKTVLLDSDILCLRTPPGDAFPGAVNAKPADYCTWPTNGNTWDDVYALFGFHRPERLVKATVSETLMPPYFNSGVVAVENNKAFAEAWADCCLQIDSVATIKGKRPWLDQIALPVAIARLGCGFYCLGEDLNFPAHAKPVPAERPVFSHYHWPKVIRSEPALNALVTSLVREHPGLETILASGGPDWKRLLEPYRTASPGRAGSRVKLGRLFEGAHAATPKGRTARPELVITGIPRSGTSLLCRLLDDLQDCVVINEPAEIFAPLTLCENPWWLGLYYRDLRRQILDGEEIENKIVDGHVVEDTSTVDQRVCYCPAVRRPDFLLGTKNTLAYLARLRVIRRAMPHAAIAVCVRHPLDTIASWIGTFPHLRDVSLRDFPVSYVDNPFLSGLEQRRLQDIVNTQSAEARRALLWAHLAETVAEFEGQILLVKYETLVAAPDLTVGRILKATRFPGKQTRARRVLEPRSRRDLLQDADLSAVRDLCVAQAARLGYGI